MPTQKATAHQPAQPIHGTNHLPGPHHVAKATSAARTTPLETHSKVVLMHMAADRSIHGRSRMNKEELIEALQAAQ